jgi:hypothetical protein
MQKLYPLLQQIELDSSTMVGTSGCAAYPRNRKFS